MLTSASRWPQRFPRPPTHAFNRLTEIPPPKESGQPNTGVAHLYQAILDGEAHVAGIAHLTSLAG
jgi:hypothetical protein